MRQLTQRHRENEQRVQPAPVLTAEQQLNGKLTERVTLSRLALAHSDTSACTLTPESLHSSELQVYHLPPTDLMLNLYYPPEADLLRRASVAQVILYALLYLT